MSIAHQCRLLEVHRSRFYYEPIPESELNLLLMRIMDRLHLDHPFAGSRMLSDLLCLRGHFVNRKRTQRLMRLMGIEAIYPKKNLSKPHPGHRIFPYLLRNVEIVRPNHVWSIDITYLPVRGGFLYLVAIIDWFSRCVLAWELSSALTNDFCMAALDRALQKNRPPEIFNSDQGAQFTAENFIAMLLAKDIQVSMDGRGRALDNVFIERLWRTVKYEELFIRDYGDGHDAFNNLTRYFKFYNLKRPHSSLAGRTPFDVYESPMR